MFARMFAVAGATLAAVLVLGSEPLDAQDKAKAKATTSVKGATTKATVKATAKAKAKFEPLNTDALFKKLDTNKDSLLDNEEFGRILTVEPAPRRKGKDAEAPDLPFIFKSLDADGDKMLSREEFKGVVGAIYPNGKK
jgi:hypothetical protein